MNTAHRPPEDMDGEWERKGRCVIASGRRPHFSPDADMLAIQRRRIAGHIATHGQNSNALVLGATPELMDLAIQAGLRVTSVDCSPTMLEAAAGRRETTDPAREAHILGNWLDMNMIGDGTIDIVLGDASLNNLRHRQMPVVLDEIARVTHKESMVSLRQIVLPDEDAPEYGFQPALAALRAGKISLHEFDRVLRFYSFNARALDPEQHRLDARRVFAAIREKHTAGELSAREYDFLIGRNSEVAHTVYPLSEQTRLLERLGSCVVEQLPETCFFRRLMAHFTVRVR